MRLAVICQAGTANSHYRAILPLRELERRGHTVMWPGHASFGTLREGKVPKWDLLHIHQFISPSDLEMVQRLQAAGVAVVWDTDDDLSAPPKGTDSYRRLGRRRGIRKLFQQSVEIASAASLLTTTNEHLAGVYRGAGVERIAVIENHLAPEDVEGTRRRHQGVVIGLVAAGEHVHDLRRLRIAETLQRILQTHAGVQIVALGEDLKLRDPRYVYHRPVQIERMIELVRTFDIGLAPLTDSPMARSRSNVKVKEYAAGGGMWLASPIGPYVGLGEQQGGLLVADDDWFETLDALVVDYRRRSELAARAQAWARRQTIQQAGDAWESAFRGAIQHARGARVAAGA